MSEQKVSQGRIVIFTDMAVYENREWPALVIKAHDDQSVDLCVFTDSGINYMPNVPTKDNSGVGEAFWGWPPRV